MGDFVEPPPNPNSKTLVFWVFSIPVGQPPSLANPTNIAKANPDPPTPADRVVPIHGWRTKIYQRGDKWTKGAYLPHIGDFVEPPPNPNSKALVFWVFSIPVGQPPSLANPTNTAKANPDPPTPADRVVPIHGWRTKKDQKGDKWTKGAYLPHMGDFVEPPPNPNSKTLVFCFFQSRLANHQVWPTRPISLRLTQTPLPQLTVWSQFMAEKTKKDQKGDKWTKKGERRWVVVSLMGFHRVRCLGGGSTKSRMCGK